MTRIIKRQIQILQHLRKKETLRIIHPPAKPIIIINIPNPRKRPIHAQHPLKTRNRSRSSIQILRISSDSEGVEVAFEHLWAQDIFRPAVEDVEPVLGV